MKKRARYLEDVQGSVAIEFALVCPVLLLMMFGTMAYGLYFLAAHSAAQLAANAARASVAGITDAEREKLAKAAVSTELKPHPLFVDTSKIVVTVGSVASDPSAYRVAVTYDAEGLPIWNMSPFLPLPSRYIEQSAVVKKGGY